MFDIGQWLDRAKTRHGVTSDYKLAQFLGVSHGSITNYRQGKTMPDERITLKLCELSGDDPEHVAACIQSMRAANDDAADLWRRIAARLRGTAGAIATAMLVLFALSALDLQAPAAAATLSSDCYVKWIAALLLVRFARRLLTQNRWVTA